MNQVSSLRSFIRQRSKRLTMRIIAIVSLGIAIAHTPERALAQRTADVTSPNGQLVMEVTLDRLGRPSYSVRSHGREVVRSSALGLIRDDADFSLGLRLANVARVERVTDQYEILTAKRRLNRYLANRRVLGFTARSGARMDLIIQVSDDGVAFRYRFPDTSTTVHSVRDELTSFHMPAGTRAWLQPMQIAKTGWGRSNPAYEEFYRKEIPAGEPAPTAAGWVFPALFRTDSSWLLVSETALASTYAGARLRADAPDGEYRIGFPDPREGMHGGPVKPRSTLPWQTPWRLIVIGSLRTVTESMLGVDLAEPAIATTESWILPGKGAWSWPLMGDRSITYDVQRRFIDYAADMRWQYSLIDNYWDRQIGEARIRDLAEYARTKGVKLLLWYNSAGDWNTTPQTPFSRMLTRERRLAEFARLRALGVAGVKIDFFGGDGQSVIAYYHDIMRDALASRILVNFHGSTVPRGWHRTYPNLMTMEGVKGLEFVTFDQRNADEEPTHATMLPFTRNVFDPMDFTPVVLDRIRNIQRRTTSGFELALSVLFTSGIQHYAEIPDGMAKAPDVVKDFLRGVPSIWDDVRFLDGYPGRFVVMARRSGSRWYVAGINGDSTARTATLQLRDIAGSAGLLITDGDEGNLSFRHERVALPPTRAWSVMMQPRGGFVLVVE